MVDFIVPAFLYHGNNIETDRQFEIEKADIGIGCCHDAADFAVIHSLLRR